MGKVLKFSDYKRDLKITLITSWMYGKDYHMPFSPFKFLFVVLLLQFWCGAPDTTVQRISFTVLQESDKRPKEMHQARSSERNSWRSKE